MNNSAKSGKDVAIISETVAVGKEATNNNPVKKPAIQPVGVTVHGEGETQWWFDARGLDDPQMESVLEESSCTHLVVNFEQRNKVRTKKQKVVWVQKAEQLSELEQDAWVFTDVERIHAQAIAKGHRAGMFIDVKNLENEFRHCVEICERGDDFVVINIEHATYIPFELLLAKAEGKRTKILRCVPVKGLDNDVTIVNQSLNAFGTMECGISVLFSTKSVEEVQQLSRIISQRQGKRIQLVPAVVEEVQHTGLGHRVCIDTTSLMTAEEGMIVGSTGWGGLFICSETHYLPHMNLREFRVNAGGVHSYIWGPNNNAMYLSEMKAGLEVLCTDIRGNSRIVTVGRAKIERRPLIKIRCSVGIEEIPHEMRYALEETYRSYSTVTPPGEKFSSEDLQRIYINVFIQNDWHVRVMGADGTIRHGTLIRPGDKLLAHVDRPGRHTGLTVNEHIVER